MVKLLTKDIADPERGAGLKRLEPRDTFSPIDGGSRESRGIDRNAVLLREQAHATHVIGMFVRDHDGVEAFGRFADLGQPARQFAQAEPGIDQDARAVGRQPRGVAGTSARQNAESNDATLPNSGNRVTAGA